MASEKWIVDSFRKRGWRCLSCFLPSWSRSHRRLAAPGQNRALCSIFHKGLSRKVGAGIPGMTTVDRAWPAFLTRGRGTSVGKVFTVSMLKRFLDDASGYRLCRAHPGLSEIEYQGRLLPPPTRLGGGYRFHGLTPTAKCGRRIRGLLEPPGWRPGNCHLKILSAWQCCDLGPHSSPGGWASAGKGFVFSILKCFLGEPSEYTLCWARPGLSEIENQR